jgi:hypothetical protein
MEGYFNGGVVAPYATYDGIVLESDNGYRVKTYNNGTITGVVERADWLDKLDGTGPSGITIDWTKGQILRLEYLWLGYGGVVASFLFDGQIVDICRIASANVHVVPYMSSPNQPCRSEIRSVGGAGNYEHVCATVGNYGELSKLGYTTPISSGLADLALALADTQYGCIFIRLKSTHLDVKIDLAKYNARGSSNDDFNIDILRNPTIGGAALTWTAIADSALEVATGQANVRTVTGGKGVEINSAKQATAITSSVENVLRLGSATNGTSDIFAVAVTPKSASLSVALTVLALESI